MQIGWGIFNPTQGESLDWTVCCHHHSVHHVLLIEAVCLQVVHGVVSVIRGRMARRTLPFTKEHFLPVHFGRCSFGGVQFSIPSELGSWRKVQQFLKFAHEMNLAAPFEGVYTFLCRNDRISIEIGCTLFELRKILNCLQSS